MRERKVWRGALRQPPHPFAENQSPNQVHPLRKMRVARNQTCMNTNGTETNIFCGREPFWREIRFWFKQVKYSPGKNSVYFAQPLTLIEMKPEEEGREMPPMFSLRDEQAQTLMDELWRVGLRPSEGSGSVGSLAATERHLKDMRHLVFKTKP